MCESVCEKEVNYVRKDKNNVRKEVNYVRFSV